MSHFKIPKENFHKISQVLQVYFCKVLLLEFFPSRPVSMGWKWFAHLPASSPPWDSAKHEGCPVLPLTHLRLCSRCNYHIKTELWIVAESSLKNSVAECLLKHSCTSWMCWFKGHIYSGGFGSAPVSSYNNILKNYCLIKKFRSKKRISQKVKEKYMNVSDKNHSISHYFIIHGFILVIAYNVSVWLLSGC